MRIDPTWDDHVIYGLLNADISDNATVYCAIPFGHYMGDHIVSLNEHTCSDIYSYVLHGPSMLAGINQFWLVLYNQSTFYRCLG